MPDQPPCILVVEDEPAVLDLLVYNLRKAHYDVQTAANGRSGLDLARRLKPDLVLLDLMLPEIDGLEVCRELRSQPSQVPIIMLTARSEEIDRVLGLELGADDYVSKPFSMRELMARVKAVLRRARPEAAQAAQLSGPGGLVLDGERREARTEGGPLELTRLEFDLLWMLLLNRGRVLSRARLLEEVWGYDFAGDTRAVDSAIKRLRARLRAASLQADGLEAVRGLGYKFKGEQE